MKQKFILITIASIMALMTQAQITLGTRRAVLDSLTGNWLCSVPDTVFNNNFEATFNCTEPWENITIDGQPINIGDSYTFTQVAGDKMYHLVAHIGDSITIDGNICFTFNPIFELTGTFNDDYQVTGVIANMPANQGPINMLTKVKHRGGSTNTENRLKRNYHFKFINPDSTKMDRKFFGLRSDNSWILDAGQIDMLRIRNRVATELWMDFCTPPYYADREPKALSGVRGDFIELFLNGKYNGIYALTEAMDRKQMRLAKYEEPDTIQNGTFHGMLWKAKAIDVITRMSKFYGYNNNRDMWGGFEIKYPDPDDVMPTDYSTLGNAVKFVVNSSRNEFRQHVAEYFDIPVIIDYWIYINVILGIDSGVKNIYWATYDQTLDKKLTLAVWDLDCTFGQNWINYPLHNPTAVGSNVPLSTAAHLFWRLIEISPDSFSVKTVERYQQLRQGVLSEDSIKQRFRDRLQPLFLSGAIARETQRWTKAYDISGQPLDFEAELAYLEQWVDERLPYMDNSRFRPYIMGDSNRDGIVDVADVNNIIQFMLRGDAPMWYEDMNHDDMLDVADINAIINIMLGK